MLAVVIAIAVGAAILFPSLALLFRLSLAGNLRPSRAPHSHTEAGAGRAPPNMVRACCRWRLLLAGVVLLTIADSPTAHAVGVFALAAATIAGFTAIGPDQLAEKESSTSDKHPERRREQG